MNCKYCGKPVPYNSPFCRECGNKVEVEPGAQLRASKKACPMCAELMDVSATVCSKCGTFMPNENNASQALANMHGSGPQVQPDFQPGFQPGFPNSTNSDFSVGGVRIEAQSALPSGNDPSFLGTLGTWNWGGFLFTWLWAGFNISWVYGLIALAVSFIPFGGLFAAVYLGLKGNDLSWTNRKYYSVGAFKEVQSRWTTAGIALYVLGALLSLGLLFFSAALSH